MKKGLYVIYQGVEYKAGAISPDIFSLHSNDRNDVKKGFELNGSIYLKRVHEDEVEEAYTISPHAIYQGYEFGVEREEEDRLLLFTGDYTAYKKFNMKIIDRGVYEKWINKSDITSVYEEKDLL